MTLNLGKFAGATALVFFAASVFSVARSQQVVPTSPLQNVSQSAVPANSTTLGTTGAGAIIVQTTDPSVMTTSAFPYSYGNLSLPNYSAPALSFNVSSAGTIEYSVAPSGIVRASSHVAGVDDVTAGLGALQDNNGGGCAIALCVAAGANASVLAGPCQTVLNDMARLLRLGQAVPSCAGSTVTYTPITCAAPWTLVSLEGWESFACQALIQPSAPTVPPGPSVAEQCAVAYANAEFWSADIETGVYSDAAGNWYAWDVAFNTIEFVAGTVACPNVSGGVGWGGYSGAGGTGADGNSSGNANSGNASDAGAGGASSGDGGGGGDGGD